jgi:hypothetical protein
MNYKKTRLGIVGFLVLTGITLFPALLSGQEAKPALEDDTRAYFEVLRSRFNTDKVAIINQVLNLSDLEAAKFWPIYRAYEQELAGVGDRKLELIREFFAYHKNGTLNDERAKSLSQRWLKNLQDRTNLWKKYQKKISRAVSPTRAAQFLQIENQMALFIDLSIASEMPAIGSNKP